MNISNRTIKTSCYWNSETFFTYPQCFYKQQNRSNGNLWLFLIHEKKMLGIQPIIIESILFSLVCFIDQMHFHQKNKNKNKITKFIRMWAEMWLAHYRCGCMLGMKKIIEKKCSDIGLHFLWIKWAIWFEWMDCFYDFLFFVTGSFENCLKIIFGPFLILETRMSEFLLILCCWLDEKFTFEDWKINF